MIFSIEKALSGEPVKLRNGKKACVLVKIPSNEAFGYRPTFPLMGFTDDLKFIYWTEDGRSSLVNDEASLDIIGMWDGQPIPFNLTQALAGKPIALKHKPTEKCYLVGESRSETYAKGVYIVQQQISDDDLFFPISIETLSENYVMWQEPEQ